MATDIGDPDVIFVSATCPRSKLLDYALSRLTTAAPTFSAPGEPRVRKVSLYGVNSAIAHTVTLAEIIKRRLPHAVYACKVGSAMQQPAESATKVGDAAKPAAAAAKKYAIQIDFVVYADNDAAAAAAVAAAHATAAAAKAEAPAAV